MRPWDSESACCVALFLFSLWLSPNDRAVNNPRDVPSLHEILDADLGFPILGFDVSNNSDLTALALGGGKVRVFRTDSGEVLHEFAFESANGKREILRVHFSPDGKLIAISHRGIVQLFEVGSWRELSPVGPESKDGLQSRETIPPLGAEDELTTVTDFAFTRDGRTVIAGYCQAGCEPSVTIETVLIARPTGRNLLRLWDLDRRRIIWQANTAEVPERVVPSPDEMVCAVVSQMLTGQYRNIRVYDLKKGELLYSLPEFRSNSLAPNVLFTSDGKNFITASRTSSGEGQKSHRDYCQRMHLGIFEVQSGKSVSQIVNSYGAVDAAALSADDRWLAAQTCMVPGFQLWDMRTSEAVLRVHPRIKAWKNLAVDILVFSQDGRSLVVANARHGLLAVFRSEF